MDSLSKLKEIRWTARKTSRIQRKLVRPLKPYGNSQRIHACLLPRDHVTNTWWKFQQILTCIFYMLATCQIFSELIMYLCRPEWVQLQHIIVLNHLQIGLQPSYITEGRFSSQNAALIFAGFHLSWKIRQLWNLLAANFCGFS